MHKKIIDTIVGSSTRYTLHTHTQFCDGRAAMDDFARQAVQEGFEYYGFTPHSPIPFESPCNMSFDSVAEYLAEVERIRRVYGEHCRFLAGMEIDYIDADWGPHVPYFAELGLDYSIGSVHFIPDFDGEPVDIDGRFDSFKQKMTRHFREDIDYVVNTFFDHSEAMVRAGGFDILGHADKIAQNASYYAPGIEDSEMFRRRVNDLLSLAIEKDIAVEINTKARVEHRRIFPSECYLPRLVAAAVCMPVNSDAHRTDRIDASRDYAIGLVQSLKNLAAK